MSCHICPINIYSKLRAILSTNRGSLSLPVQNRFSLNKYQRSDLFRRRQDSRLSHDGQTQIGRSGVSPRSYKDKNGKLPTCQCHWSQSRFDPRVNCSRVPNIKGEIPNVQPLWGCLGRPFKNYNSIIFVQ